MVQHTFDILSSSSYAKSVESWLLHPSQQQVDVSCGKIHSYIAALLEKIDPRVPFDRSVGEPQSQSERCI
jgi:hypothetical protein